MTPAEFRAVGHRLIDFIADYHAGIAQRPVMPAARPGEIKALLPAEPPETGEPAELEVPVPVADEPSGAVN